MPHVTVQLTGARTLSTFIVVDRTWCAHAVAPSVRIYTRVCVRACRSEKRVLLFLFSRGRLNRSASRESLSRSLGHSMNHEVRETVPFPANYRSADFNLELDIRISRRARRESSHLEESKKSGKPSSKHKRSTSLLLTVV